MLIRATGLQFVVCGPCDFENKVVEGSLIITSFLACFREREHVISLILGSRRCFLCVLWSVVRGEGVICSGWRVLSRTALGAGTSKDSASLTSETGGRPHQFTE